MKMNFSLFILASVLLFSQCSLLQKGDYVEDAGCGLNMKMVYVEGGSFDMGGTFKHSLDARTDEYPIHKVNIDSYYIAECEVTQEQWQKIMGTTIYHQRDLAQQDLNGTKLQMCGVGNDYPMYYVNWNEAQAFCSRLSAITGKTYVLPTEAQWEYAARGGANDEGFLYGASDNPHTVAWYKGNSTNSAMCVKCKQSNALGLYDMCGNVWEWCNDYYGFYSQGVYDNPTGPWSGQFRVSRGGSWMHESSYCRVTSRVSTDPSKRFSRGGLRVVCLEK